jgi:hypothetical protein
MKLDESKTPKLRVSRYKKFLDVPSGRSEYNTYQSNAYDAMYEQPESIFIIDDFYYQRPYTDNRIFLPPKTIHNSKTLESSRLVNDSNDSNPYKQVLKMKSPIGKKRSSLTPYKTRNIKQLQEQN